MRSIQDSHHAWAFVKLFSDVFFIWFCYQPSRLIEKKNVESLLNEGQKSVMLDAKWRILNKESMNSLEEKKML